MASMFKRAVWGFVNHPAPEWIKVTGVVGGLCAFAIYSVARETAFRAPDSHNLPIMLYMLA
jgi:hypothetical protein